MKKKRKIIENMPDYFNNQLNAAIEAFKKGFYLILTISLQ